MFYCILLYLIISATAIDIMHNFGQGVDGWSIWGSLTLVNAPTRVGNEVNKVEQQSQPVLYGRTCYGGTKGLGTIFSVNMDGSGYNVLHNFQGSPLDGGNPHHDAMRYDSDSNSLYFMTLNGGSQNDGTVMQYDIDNNQTTVLYSFLGGTDGRSPHSCVVLSNNKLYGMTAHGGDGDNGTIFSMNPDGTDEMVLHVFKFNKGSQPHAFLIPDSRPGLSDILYGVTRYGGPDDLGLIFSFNTTEEGFNVLAYFSKDNGSQPHHGGLLQVGSTLLGLTSSHGKYGYGTAYSYDLDAGILSNTHNFGGHGDPCQKPKGSFVDGGDGYVYATTEDGGENDNGCVFRIAYDGSAYQILYEFKGPTSDGESPLDNVLLYQGTVYGMTKEGGLYPNKTPGDSSDSEFESQYEPEKTSYDSGIIFSFAS